MKPAHASSKHEITVCDFMAIAQSIEQDNAAHFLDKNAQLSFQRERNGQTTRQPYEQIGAV